MALDPITQDEMFPDTYVQPFVTSTDLADVADDVLRKWDEFKALRDAIDSEANPVQIAYVLDTKKLGDDEDLTVHTIVNVTKASPLWRSLTGIAVVVAYRQVAWDNHDAEERAGFVHHGLGHIDTLAGKVAIRPHPAEGFPWTFRRYGPLSIGERMFARASALWNEDHPVEPTPLRSVDETDEA